MQLAVFVGGDALTAVPQWRTTIPALIQAITTDVAKEIQKELKKTPGPVRYPIAWTSEKQRRFYFAMRREQGKPPKYRRTGRRSRGWKVQKLGNESAMVTNEVPYVSFVQGDRILGGWQQRFHRNTGWMTDREAWNRVVDGGAMERAMDARLGEWADRTITIRY